jgi:thiamine-phosphate pyrophosphorylase
MTPPSQRLASQAIDWGLYVITDRQLTRGRPLEEVVAAALRGGAGVIQYRDKWTSTRVMVDTGARLAGLCRAVGACFIVNDRLDVALAVDADGVHLGQDDMPLPLARRLLGAGRLIGVSVHNEVEIRCAEEAGADYVSLCPAFATLTKRDHQEPLGFNGVRSLAAAARVPVVTIGGIDRTNAGHLMACGVCGVCVVSAVMAAPDAERAAREILEAMGRVP